MKILIPTEYYPPFVRGGGEISTKILAEELAKKHDVTVLTPNYFSRSEELKGKENGVKINRFRFISHAPTKSGAKKRSFFNLFHSLYIKHSAKIFKNQIEKYVKKKKVDIIHAQNLESILGLADAKIDAKKIAYIRDLRIIEKRDHRNKLKKFDLIFVNSKFIEKECKKKKIKTKVLYNPIDKKIISKLTKKQAKEKFLTTTKKIILFVGGLEKKKGAHLIPEIARENPEYNFFVIGKGSLEYDKDFIKNRPGNMNPFFFIPYEELADYYRAADILIVPSLWQEPFGRVVIEAYANATPVIATNIGGLPEIVDKHTGFLISPKEVEKEITRIIKRLNDKQIKMLSRNAYKKSKQFTATKIVKDLLKEYRKL